MRLLLLIIGSIAAAGTLGAEVLSYTERRNEVPVREPETAPQPLAQGDGYRFDLKVDSAQRQWKFADTANQQSLTQNLGLAYRQNLIESMILTWEGGLGARRDDTIVLDPDEALARESMALTQRINLALQPGKFLTVNTFTQTSRTLADGETGFEDALKIGTEVVLMPWEGSTLRGETSRLTKFGFDSSIILQNIAGVKIEQRIPYTPLKLQVGATATNEETQLLSASEKDSTKFLGSIVWTIQPKTTWAVGLENQETAFVLSDAGDEKTVYFTELGLQPGDAIGVNLRAGYELRDTFAANGVITQDEPALSLSIGVNVKVAEQMNAGIGVRYRIPEVLPAATPANTDETIFSLSASGYF